MGLDNPLHIVILLVILLLVFGAKRAPGAGTVAGHWHAWIQRIDKWGERRRRWSRLRRPGAGLDARFGG